MSQLKEPPVQGASKKVCTLFLLRRSGQDGPIGRIRKATGLH